MSVGLGIFLMALGAILSFAISDRIAGVNLAMVGYILMGAGVLSLIMALLRDSRRTEGEHVSVVERREVGPRQDLRDPHDPRI